MDTKLNLLVVCDYNRKDFLDLFKSCKHDFNFFFIEYATIKEVKTDHYKEYGKALFWKDFSDAFELLNIIKPSKVIFFFIEAYNHVALNVACKEKCIPTYHLEHGVRDYERTALINKNGARRPKVQVLKKTLRVFSYVIVKIKTRSFFWKTAQKTSQEARTFLNYYFHIRSKHTIFETFKIVNSPFRIADIYISFSSAIYKAHQIADHLSQDQKVYFIGVPSFDEWANFQLQDKSSKTVVFIDQAFVKQGLLGWTKAFHFEFVNKLAEICSLNGYKLFVKIHPLEDANAWYAAQNDGKLKIVTHKEEFKTIVAHTKIVMGYYSTLLMPLTALPHTTLITLENHPVHGVYPSKFLVESGVSHPVFNIDELPSIFERIEYYHQKQLKHKKDFVNKWLYKFDGHAGNKLRSILIDVNYN